MLNRRQLVGSVAGALVGTALPGRIGATLLPASRDPFTLGVASGYPTPAAGATARPLRLALASCQHYEHGFYTAYRHMAGGNLDLVVHVGDYIYELGSGRNQVRHHGGHECYSLDDYRRRHALYKLDPDLQAAHAACPWMVTWDDHEVDNDYAGGVDEENNPVPLFLARRAAAYRAYYEHMPLPRQALPFGPDLRLHTTRSFGGLAHIHMLDGRQFRTPQACPPPGRRGGSRASCEELFAPDRTMLGLAQEAWLGEKLRRSGSRWNLLAQQTVMTHLDEQPGPGETYWTDSWNGYPAARSRLLGVLAEPAVSNPVVLSGDIHAFGVANLNQRPEAPESPVVASEFVTTSITSQGVPAKMIDDLVAGNPNLIFATAEHRGYVRLDLSAERLEAALIAVNALERDDPKARVLARYVVEAGRPGPQPA